MGISDRYIQDIEKCLEVYGQLYQMTDSDKIDVIDYIGDFYRKQKDADGRKQLYDNQECYKRIMTNIHMFRWLEIEKSVGSAEVKQAMQRNDIWTKTTKELATEALNILNTIGVKPEQNGYDLGPSVLINYVKMQRIETQQVDDSDDDDFFGDDTYDTQSTQAQFDEIDKQDLGFQDTEDDFDDVFGTDEDTDNDEDELDEDELDEDELDEDELDEDEDDDDFFDDEEEEGYEGEPENYDDETQSQGGQLQDTDTEQKDSLTEQQKRELEAQKIKEAAEIESNRVEIPIDTKTNSNIDLQFDKFIQQQYVAALMPQFRELYSSCFTGITQPDGVLTPQGVLKYEQLQGDTKKQWHFNHQTGISEETQVYKNYMNMVFYAIGIIKGAQQCKTATSDMDALRLKKAAIKLGREELGYAMGFQADSDDTGRFPRVQHLKRGNVYYPYMHHAFMTGYYALCSGLKKESEENNYHHNTVKVTSYDDLSKWISKQIKTCLLKAIAESNLGDQPETYEVDAICKSMLDCIKNVVFIADKQKAFLTLKICQNRLHYSQAQLQDALNDYLTSTSGTTQGTKAIVKDLKDDVATIDIVLDVNKYNSQNLMAAQVIDSVIESGQLPSWDNAIIGRDDKGIVNYDFTKQNRCAVQIYGQSGSGKGLMTQALIQNALIDNCNVFYFDGKPDNGAALGKVAWDRDKEAAVFNGLTGGQDTFSDTLEAFQHGKRSPDRLYELDSIIPDFEQQPVAPVRVEWPFQTTTQTGQNLRKQLLDVSRTLKAFEFICDMVEIRANGRDEKAGIDNYKDFCVFIIDEIQNAATAEKAVRQQMNYYMQQVETIDVVKTVQKTTKNGIETQEKRDGKIKDVKNWGKDPGYIFCKKWISWANNLISVQWNELVTKQLRNSNQTIITIFQTNDWFTMDDKGIGRYGQTTCSRIGHLMRELQAKVTKIAGKNGLKATGQNSWGDLPGDKYKWHSDVQKGKWAIARDESGFSDDVQLVRPFMIFTTDLGHKVRCSTDDRFAGGQSCRTSKYDTKDEQGNDKKDPAGLDSYLQYMFNNLHSEILQKRTVGLTPEEVLQKGYDYFESCVKTFGKADQLQDYFYKIPDMVTAVKQGDDEDQVLDFDDQEDESDDFSIEDSSVFDLKDDEQTDDFLKGLNDATDEDGSDTDGHESSDSDQLDSDYIVDEESSIDFNDLSNLLDDDNADDGVFSQQKQGHEQVGFLENQDQQSDYDEYGADSLQTDGIDFDWFDYSEQGNEQGIEFDTVEQSETEQALGEEPEFNRGRQKVEYEQPIQESQQSDDFGDLMSEYQDIQRNQGQQYGYSREPVYSAEAIQSILSNPNMQADEKLLEMGKLIQRGNVKVNPVDCIPLEGRMIYEGMDTDRSGMVNFGNNQSNQGNQSSRARRLNSQTIVASDTDVGVLGNIRTEDNKTLQTRFETILNVIDQSIDKNMVIKLMMTETTIQVNGRNLFLGRLLTNELQVADIVSIERTFNTFGNLKTLIVDMQVFGAIQGEYELDNPIPKMFMRSPSLRQVTLLGNNGRMAQIQREDMYSIPEEVMDMIFNQQNVDKLDTISAQFINDTNYRVVPVQAKRRIARTQARMSNASFGDKNTGFTTGRIQREGKSIVKRQGTGSVGVQARRGVNQTLNGIGNIMGRFGKKTK